MSDDLREQQSFFLRSLRDLEREHDAGDIDDNDYAALRDEYVARAAAVTRLIEAGESGAVEPRGATRWSRRILVAAFVLAVGVGGGVLVAGQSGQRLPGQSATGGIDQSTASLLATARQLNFSDPGKAIETYTQVLKTDPDNVEALTYRSWILALTARDAEAAVKKIAFATAITDLLRAQNIDETYADPHCFLGIVYFRFLDNAELAGPQLRTCRDMNPPAEVSGMVDAVIAQVDEALKD